MGVAELRAKRMERLRKRQAVVAEAQDLVAAEVERLRELAAAKAARKIERERRCAGRRHQMPSHPLPRQVFRDRTHQQGPSPCLATRLCNRGSLVAFPLKFTRTNTQPVGRRYQAMVTRAIMLIQRCIRGRIQRKLFILRRFQHRMRNAAAHKIAKVGLRYLTMKYHRQAVTVAEDRTEEQREEDAKVRGAERRRFG